MQKNVQNVEQNHAFLNKGLFLLREIMKK